MSAECRSCHAEVVWVVNEKSGKRIALDPVPKLTHGTRFVVTGKGVDEQNREVLSARSCKGQELGMRAHFASCPNAASWRR